MTGGNEVSLNEVVPRKGGSSFRMEKLAYFAGLLVYLVPLVATRYLEKNLPEWVTDHWWYVWIALFFGSFVLFLIYHSVDIISRLSISWIFAASLMMGTLLRYQFCFLLGGLIYIVLDKCSSIADGETEKITFSGVKAVSAKEFFKKAEIYKERQRFYIGEVTDLVKGIFCSRDYSIPQEHIFQHIHLVGTTGTGKTQLLMEFAYQTMIRRWGLIYVTAKSASTIQENDFTLFKYLVYRADRLKSLHVFDPYMPGSHTFNPVRPIGPWTPIQMANQMARLMGREPPAQQERAQDFHLGIDHERASVLSKILIEMNEEFVSKDIYTYFADLGKRETLFSKLSDRQAGELVRLARAGLEGTILMRSHTSGLTSNLFQWVSDPLDKMVNDYTPDIQIDQILEKGDIAFFKLPAGTLSKQVTAIGRMILGQVLACMELPLSPVPRPPALIILDEFSQYLTPIIIDLLSTIRAGRIGIILASQDFGQLSKVEGIDKEAFKSGITNGTTTKLFFNTSNADDAEMMAKTFGTVPAKSYTKGRSKGEGGGRTSYSERIVEEFFIHPNWFKEPKKFQAAVKSEEMGKAKIRTVFFGRVPDVEWSPRKTGLEILKDNNGKRPMKLYEYVPSLRGKSQDKTFGKADKRHQEVKENLWKERGNRRRKSYGQEKMREVLRSPQPVQTEDIKLNTGK